MAAMITFIGTTEDTGVDTLTWGPHITLPAGTAVLVDPDDAETVDARFLYEHLLSVAPNHPHFTIEDVPAARKKSKAKAKDEESAEDEENGDDFPGDYPEIPPDWQNMHHKKLIALARKLGGEGDALATRDGAIEYIDEYLALGGGTTAPKPHERA